MNSNLTVDEIPLRSMAHLGDAVYELYVRNKLIFYTSKLQKLHKLTTSFVSSKFHADLTGYLLPLLTEDEQKLVKRARNLPLTVAKRKEQTIHRISTSLEALIGFLYLKNRPRLDEIFVLIDEYIDEQLNNSELI